MINKKYKISLAILLGLCVIALLVIYLHGHTVAVFSPKGPVAYKERQLIFFALALSLIVVVPVFGMTFFFAWKYRETNSKAQYRPEWDHSRIAESVWWGVPAILILILSVVAWNSSHALDPFKPLSSNKTPITIQVVALTWKWLFIYPQQDIASVNFVQFPKATPVDFEITADAPMNSFWIPQLGGQIYAMPGMATQLHLMAYGDGSYYGSSANISGVGFAGMHFMAKSTSAAAFNDWAASIRQSSHRLSQNTYNQLARPSVNMPVTYYADDAPDLFNTIVQKYLGPNNQMSGMEM